MVVLLNHLYVFFIMNVCGFRRGFGCVILHGDGVNFKKCGHGLNVICNNFLVGISLIEVILILDLQ